MPDTMDRRDFLIRLAIGAAFALAGLPLLGEWLREWAGRRQRLAEWTRQYRALNERLTFTPVHGLSGDYLTSHFAVGNRVALVRSGVSNAVGRVVSVKGGLTIEWGAV